MIPKQILVPTDFSETAERGVRYAFELAQHIGAKVHLLHVYLIPTPPVGGALAGSFFEETEDQAKRRLEEATHKYREHPSFGSHLVTTGEPSGAIVEVARKIGADLIVIGTHGRSGVQRLLLGSVAETVLRSAPCPVLAMRLPENAP